MLKIKRGFEICEDCIFRYAKFYKGRKKKKICRGVHCINMMASSNSIKETGTCDEFIPSTYTIH